MSWMGKIEAGKLLPSLWFVAAAGVIVIVLAGIFIYAGVYNIAADAPHTKPVYWLLDAIRERSIEVRAGAIKPPADLNSDERVSAGAGLYAEMCTGCHLAPGMEKTELSQGLYPPAPELSQPIEDSAAEKFWVIKHGVKLTAMPAWGKTHDDELIWDMVAFIDKLPTLSPDQYQAIVASAPEDHDEMMEEMKERTPQGGDRD
ncbi:MAG TPA: cytochrome c [Parvularculaceae bacterium]|nr:cytochrome c [Parvularculaceae bacterium]